MLLSLSNKGSEVFGVCNCGLVFPVASDALCHSQTEPKENHRTALAGCPLRNPGWHTNCSPPSAQWCMGSLSPQAPGVLAWCTISLLTFNKSKGMLTREGSHCCSRIPEVSQGTAAQHEEGEYRSAWLVEELGGIRWSQSSHLRKKLVFIKDTVINWNDLLQGDQNQMLAQVQKLDNFMDKKLMADTSIELKIQLKAGRAFWEVSLYTAFPVTWFFHPLLTTVRYRTWG